jgi:hypothetical protein
MQAAVMSNKSFGRSAFFVIRPAGSMLRTGQWLL